MISASFTKVIIVNFNQLPISSLPEIILDQSLANDSTAKPLGKITKQVFFTKRKDR